MEKLSYSITVSGKVIKGDEIGKTINFPTANLSLAEKPKLKLGVYLAICQLKKQYLLGLAYYGPRYIFGKKTNSFEVYLFNFNKNIYNQELKVKLTHFIRPPKKVKNLKNLKELLKKDLHSLDNYTTLVNKHDQPIGIEEKRQTHLGSAKLHRSISVQLFNAKRELLIQKRSSKKMLWPNYWTNTVCTDVRPYETYLQAGNRRLKEEFGLTAKLIPHHQFIYHKKYLSIGSERELDQVFIGLSSKTPKPNPQEIAEYKYISLKSLKKLVKEKPNQFTPWFKLLMKRLSPSDILSS